MPGRNDLCWCGSGKKFKRCHAGRELQEKPPLERVFDDLIRNRERICLHPHASAENCRGGIIQAHTLQRSGVLSRIARDNHVYSYIPTVHTLNRTGGRFEAKLTGIRKASTFTGFCAEHDKSMFADLEDRDFSGDPKQVFLLAYRAASMELYKKAQGVATINATRE